MTVHVLDDAAVVLDAKNSSADVTVDDVKTELVETADEVKMVSGGRDSPGELLASGAGSCSLQQSFAHAH
jgi:uncharacterized OsmC-like protein